MLPVIAPNTENITSPEMAAPLMSGREYRITTAVRRKVARGAEFTGYGELYRRATTIAEARIAELTCPAEAALLHTWLPSHGWRRIDIGAAYDLLIVFQTRGIVYLNPGDAKPAGDNVPTPAELLVPGGATAEMLAAQAGGPRRMDEIYIDFDHRDPSDTNHDIVMFSYGERLPASEGIDFQPFVERAERRARFHYELLKGPSRGDAMTIVRREWMCATNPDIAVVHVYFPV